MSNYRIKYKKGDFEIEVESTEKNFVELKFKELFGSTTEPTKPSKIASSVKKATPPNSKSDSTVAAGESIDVPRIIEAISESDDYEKIDANILAKTGQLGRIIMCLNFAASTQTSPYLSTGHIQTITDQLGIKMTSQNAAKVIKNNLKYFTADGVRKMGAAIKYKLNRNGLLAFEALLRGEKI